MDLFTVLQHVLKISVIIIHARHTLNTVNSARLLTTDVVMYVTMTPSSMLWQTFIQPPKLSQNMQWRQMTMQMTFAAPRENNNK